MLVLSWVYVRFDDKNLFGSLQVYRRHDLNVLKKPKSLFAHFSDRSDDHPLWENTVETRCNEPVAFLNVFATLHIFEDGAVIQRTGDNAAGARSLNQNIHTAVGIGEQQNFGRARRHRHDLTDNPQRGHDRQPLAHAVGAPFVQETTLEPSARTVGDDRGGQRSNG